MYQANRGGQLPPNRTRANAVVSDFCTKQTLAADYAEAQPCIYRDFESSNRAVIYHARNRCRGQPWLFLPVLRRQVCT